MPPPTLPTLPTLPPDLLRHILLHTDLPTLSSLRQTCLALHHAAADESLWRQLVTRRFRVSPRTVRTRRLLAAGALSWRLLYQQWHQTSRMPTSKLSGAQHPSFARGRLSARGRAALIWVTVVSTDDCRLVAGCIRLRVVLQNLATGPPMHFDVHAASFALTDAALIPVRSRICPRQGNCHAAEGAAAARAGRRRRVVGTAADKDLPFRRDASPVSTLPDRREYAASVTDVVFARAGCPDGTAELALEDASGTCALNKDDFAILTIDVKVPRALFDIDALERLDTFHIPVRWNRETFPLVATFQEKVIWGNYERLPGGWWVRAQASTALA